MRARREFLKALAAAGLAGGAGAWGMRPAHAQLIEKPRFAADPFSLGVASGYPLPNSVALWTRLAPQPDAPGGGLGPGTIPVRWVVARDEGLKDVAASGTAYASADWAHSVHVEAGGLEPARWYWYRFSAGDAQSPVGRTRTAPGPGASPDRLAFALASCQHFEQGFFAAHRHLAADSPDLVLFVGDYIYESSRVAGQVRRHGTPEPHTLEDYRARYALYKADPDLRAAHAAAPWLVTWDDHEVENDYAADASVNLDPRDWFLARRAAAYKAWYEHMPVRRAMVPFGPHAAIHTRAAFGGLVQFHVLDNRQHRAPQACAPLGRGGSTVVDAAQCRELADPARTMLGAAQEAWLDAGFAASRARWNLVVQQTMVAQFDQQPGAGRRAWTDAWDGYPAARRRMLESVRDRKAANPVFLGGDVHMFYVTDLKTDFDDTTTAAIATEFVGTSVTSPSWSQEQVEKLLPDNPHVRHADARHRGYVRFELRPRQLRAELRGLASEKKADSACSTISAWAVEDGRPGAQKA